MDFIKESNRIEGIHRDPTILEIGEYHRFMALEQVTLEDMQRFVSIYAPRHVLRDKSGLDVRVGNYIAPRGGSKIKTELKLILHDANEFKRINKRGYSDAFQHECFKTHVAYEQLHPFTDGNGRSGRMLWWWMMGGSTIGFLHAWYYQTLANEQKKLKEL
jgi:fido (protein-threonine AMPylation protein)